jgi:hypothetical protein
MDEKTVKRLISLRKNLEKERKAFPQGNCADVSALVKRTLGLQVIQGEFVSEGKHYGHAWNYDPESGEIVDLSADQFDPKIPRVYVTANDERYVPFVNDVPGWRIISSS